MITGAKIRPFPEPANIPGTFLRFASEKSAASDTKETEWHAYSPPANAQGHALHNLKKNEKGTELEGKIRFVEQYALYLRRIFWRNRYGMNETSKLVDAVITGIQEKKGKQIVVADLQEIGDTICKYFIIAQGNSPSQIQAITESVADTTRKQGAGKPIAVDGLRNAEWVAMDYADVIVHIMLPQAHDFYDIEHLWADAMLTHIPDVD